MEWGAIGALFNVGRLAKEIYDKGFSKAQSAETQYLAFGAAINSLDQNLIRLRNAVDDAHSQLPREQPPLSRRSDETLEGILGDYKRTLKNCYKLLKERAEFVRDRAGFVTNIRWNLNIQVEVVRLTEQVAFHNIKILLVLQPLGLTLLSQIHAATGRIEARLETLIALLSGEPVAAEPASMSAASTEIFPVPADLADRFEMALRRERARTGNRRISLLEWTNSFVSFFKDGNLTLEMSNYVKLMKCVWIIQQITSDTNLLQSSDPLWQHYVGELGKRLLETCKRLQFTLAPVPDLQTILRLPEEEFSIGAHGASDSMSPEMTGETFLEELFSVVLSDIDEGAFNVQHNLRVCRNLNGSLQLQSIQITRLNEKTDRLFERTDVDLKQAHLTPLYASPDASPDAFIVQVRSDPTPSAGMTIPFRKWNDLLKFQELITGYRMVKERLNIHTNSYIDSSHVRQTGRLQIWCPPLPSRANEDGSSPSRSTLGSPTSLTHGSAPSGPFLAPSDRRPSFVTGASSSRNSALSRGTTIASTSTVNIGNGQFGFVLEEPKAPVVVFFLHDPKRDRLSFLSIQIDEKTAINPQSCKCKKNNNCLESVIERPGSGLIARKFVSSSGLKDWNIASIGIHQIARQPRVDKFRYIQIQFPDATERKKFTDTFDAVKNRYLESLQRHRRDIRDIGGHNIVRRAQ